MFAFGGPTRKKSTQELQGKFIARIFPENSCGEELGWEDSNLRVREPKSRALPLGYTPIKK